MDRDSLNTQPIISVIMPVYNVELYLEESLRCVLNQTFRQMELICVDDGSTDSSVSILKTFASSDKRVRILKQDRKGAGAARNYGFLQAAGEYVIFLDSDDLFAPDLLEKSYSAAIEKDADIVAFDYQKLYPDGTTENRNGFRRDLAAEIPAIFNYRDCPDLIMSSVHPVPWNKLYKADFIRKHNLKFEELFSTDDITFAGVSLAYAQRIAFLEERLVWYRVGRAGSITCQKKQSLDNVIRAVVSAIEQVQSLDYYELIKNSAARFAIGNLFFGYNNFISDYDSDDAREYYNFIHEYFNSEQFAFVTYDSIKYDVLWRFFLMIRYNEYEKLRENQKKKLLVYTARIDLTMPLGSEKAFDVLDISDYHAFCKSQQWLKKAGKDGVVIQSIHGKLDITLKIHVSGILRLVLRGVDIRDDDGNRIPRWIEYTSFRINDSEELKESRAAWHDAPIDFTRHVSPGEMIRLHAEWTGLPDHDAVSGNTALPILSTNN